MAQTLWYGELAVQYVSSLSYCFSIYVPRKSVFTREGLLRYMLNMAFADLRWQVGATYPNRPRFSIFLILVGAAAQQTCLRLLVLLREHGDSNG